MKNHFSKTVKIVFAAHLALVMVLCIQHVFSKDKPKTKMVVRTIQPHSQAITASSVKKEKPKQGAAAPKKAIPPVAQKQTAIKTQAPLKQMAPSKKGIASSKASEIPLPKTIPATKIDESPIAKETPVQNTPSYGEILTTYLQNSLDLPEYGEVKVDLEIDCFGQLVRFEILEEKSKKNADFLKKRLPELVLPCFNEVGKLHETATFTITFKNSSSPFSNL